MRHLSRRQLLSVAALSPMAFTARGVAEQDPVNPPPTSCPAPRLMATTGVAAGQGLIVSLFHHDEAQFPSSPCVFKIEVLGLAGELLGVHDGEIVPGKGALAFFDVAHGLKKGQRVQVHINVTAPAGHPIGATAEVIDLQTGETRYPVNPCAEPEPFVLAMGTVGIMRDQIVRVSLFYHLEPGGSVTPCLFKITLIGIDGSLLGSDTGQMLSGTGVVFDYDLAKTAGLKKQGERLPFHADVWVEEPAEVGSIVEIVDAKSGETMHSVTPCLLPYV